MRALDTLSLLLNDVNHRFSSVSITCTLITGCQDSCLAHNLHWGNQPDLDQPDSFTGNCYRVG